jgi:Sec-independent protein translocase protein TatA
VEGNTEIILNLVGGLGTFGVVVWLVYHTFTKTIPKLAGDFKEALKESRQDFKEQAKQERDDFRDSLKDQHEFFKEQVGAERSQVDKVVEALREFSLRNGAR